MFAKILVIVVCGQIVFLAGISKGQGQDAQDATQSFFDQNKGADPTTDRAVTDKIQQRSDVRIQQVPVPPVVSKKPVVDEKTAKQIQDLEQQKKVFVKKHVEKEKQKTTRMLGILEPDETAFVKDANEAWDKTITARDLRRLKAKANTELKRQKMEAKKDKLRISDVPLPARTR